LCNSPPPSKGGLCNSPPPGRGGLCNSPPPGKGGLCNSPPPSRGGLCNSPPRCDTVTKPNKAQAERAQPRVNNHSQEGVPETSSRVTKGKRRRVKTPRSKPTDEEQIRNKAPVHEVDDIPVHSSGPGMVINETSLQIPEQAPADVQLHPCPHCDRRFNARALSIHVKACKRVFQSKRKAFDTTEQRYKGLVEDSELEKIKADAKKKPSRKEVEEQKSKKNKWRQEHDQLMNAMQAAKGGESAPAPVDPSLVPCPHCNRRFNKNSAARHIKICESVFSKNTHKSKRPAAARGQPKVGRR